MKHLLLILPLAACVPHVDLCLRPCDPTMKECTCDKADRDDRPLARHFVPDHPSDGGGHNGGPSDDYGDVSADSNDSNDSNGDNSA